MPDFNDLKDIKEKIDNIGNEKKIRDEKGIPLDDSSLPEEQIPLPEEELESTPSPVDDKINNEEEEDLLGDILEDFDKGHVIQEEGIEEEKKTPPEESVQKDSETEGLKDLLADTEMKEEDIEAGDKEIEALLSEGVPAGEEKIDDIGDDTGLGFDEESEVGDTEKMQELDEIGAEPKQDFEMPDLTAEESEETEGFEGLIGEEPEITEEEVKEGTSVVGSEELDALLKEPSEEAGEGISEIMAEAEEPIPQVEEGVVEDTSLVGDEELDALLKEPSEEAAEGISEIMAEAEEPIPQVEEEGVVEDTSVIGDEELGALLKQPSEEEASIVEEPKIEAGEGISEIMAETEEPIPQVEEESTSEEILEKLGEKEAESKFDDLPDLESLLGEGGIETDIGKEEIGEEAKQDLEMPDLTAEEPKITEDFEGLIGEEKEPLEEGEKQDVEISDFIVEESKEAEDLEGLIGEEFKEPESNIEEGFDLDKIGEVGTEGISDQPFFESKEEEISDIEGIEVKDSTYGKIPEEISKEDLKADHDIKLDLTDDERKQIVISLTSLPKDAELKISKAIISNKYSNTELKPLINALIDKESPHIIIKYYEKITGDKSLSAIEGVKYTGVKFEEHKKSIGYIIEKNILPFLAKASVVVVIVVLLFFATRYLIHTWQISNLYKEGRALIDKKYYLEGEEKFQKAFNDQPRYREVVKYARKYREHKRYLATEGKYDLALTMRPVNNKIVLEYSDFLREKKDFERAERMYQGMIKTDRNKLQATLGLAKTYYDWSEEERGKLEDAKEAYKDALEIDRNNKEAIFGNLRINIKQNNQKAIVNHYNYIEKKFKRRVDPEAYSELAEYFMSIDEINEVKNVLDRASKSIKRKEYYPEIEYQYARYKKHLSIFDEEEKHLKRALSIFERMKNEQESKYESDKYKKLLAKVYNNLGENAEVSVQANPEAEKFYIKAIEIDKNYGKPYYNLANFALKYKPGGYREAKENYLKAENNGYVNDRLNYNLGWVYYKEGDYLNSYNRINKIFANQPENSNLKFMLGTIFYKLGKYELSESLLLENYLHFMDLKEMYDPLDPVEKEDKIIMEMLKKVSNNLGAAYQKRYEETLNSRYIIKASKYYADSILYFDKLENIYISEVDVYGTDQASSTNQLTDKKGYANINFRMVLFPYAGVEDPILYEDFPFEYTIFM